MKKIHIALILGGGILCGVSNYVMKIIEGLEGDHFTFSLISLRDGLFSTEAKKSGIPLHILGKRIGVDPLTIYKVAKVIRSQHIDILHTQTSNSNLYGILGNLFCPACLPVVTLHAYYKEINEKAVRPYIRPFLKVGYQTELRLLQRADHIISVSKSIKDRVLADGLKANQITVIPNGIDVQKYRNQADRELIRKEFNIKPSDFLIGTAGRLSAEKNQGLILKAAARIITKEKNLKVIFFGAGPENKNLKVLTSELGLNSYVIFAGWRNDMARCLSALDTFILSSLSEVAPFVLLESMALDIPIIATNVGGVSEMIKPDSNGLLTENNNIEEMAAAISHLKGNPAYRKKLSSHGRDFVEKHFSEKTMLANTSNVYLNTYQNKLKHQKKLSA